MSIMKEPFSQIIQIQNENQSNQIQQQKNTVEGRWNHQEHLKFLNAIIQYGKDWKKVQESVHLRTGAQVRSHAQKYFLKITKIIKDRKKVKGKKVPQSTETEFQLKEYFKNHSLTQKTPREIIQLIKIQKIGIKAILQQNCNGKQKVLLKELLTANVKVQKKKIEKEKQSIVQKKQQKSVKKAFQDNFQQQSFYMWCMKKNKTHFENGGSFSALIDYGKFSKQKLCIQEQETSGNRKTSFTAFDMLN